MSDPESESDEWGEGGGAGYSAVGVGGDVGGMVVGAMSEAAVDSSSSWISWLSSSSTTSSDS